MSVNTFSNLSETAKQFYDRKLLMRALPILAIFKAADKRNIPKNGGNQVSFRRMNALATATTPLAEGITPSGDSLDMTEITGTVQQYGNFVSISDQIDLMGIDPVMSEAAAVLGENAGHSTEEIVRAELVTGTSIIYANSTGRGNQSASYPITLTLVRKAVRVLQRNDAKPFYGSRSDENGMGGMFFGWIHPNAFYDLFGDTTLQNTFTYSDPEKHYKGVLPIAGGVAWIISTKAPIFAGEGSGNADVYGTLIFGKEAFGAVDVAGTGRFQTIAHGFGSAGSADPLNQRATQGWKSLQLPKILNNNFMVRIEAGVSA